jgi:hypothetical protein
LFLCILFSLLFGIVWFWYSKVVYCLVLFGFGTRRYSIVWYCLVLVLEGSLLFGIVWFWYSKVQHVDAHVLVRMFDSNILWVLFI